jgi:dienelactone hydrolase
VIAVRSCAACTIGADTSEARYDEAAAELAWSRTIDFLKQHLADQA